MADRYTTVLWTEDLDLYQELYQPTGIVLIKLSSIKIYLKLVGSEGIEPSFLVCKTRVLTVKLTAH